MGGESVYPNQVQTTTDNNQRETRRKWNPTEDVVLISAWLNICKDPIVGNEEKAYAFEFVLLHIIQEILKYQICQNEHGITASRDCKKINDNVYKFVGFYDQALNQRASGQSEDDVVKVVYQFCYNDYNTSLTPEHTWRELRHDQKWCSSYISQRSRGNGSSKRTKVNEGDTYSSSSNLESLLHLDVEEQAMIRPLGVKSSKCKGKKAADKTTTLEEREASSRSRPGTLWELKEKT